MDTMILAFSAGTLSWRDECAGRGRLVRQFAGADRGRRATGSGERSSTVALFPGGLASAWAYRDGLESVGAVPLRALIAMWGLIDNRDLKLLKALRTLLVGAANTVAVPAFIVKTYAPALLQR